MAPFATKKKKEMDSRRKKMAKHPKKCSKRDGSQPQKVAEHAESDEEPAATVQLNSELTEMCKFMAKITIESEAHVG